MPDAFSMIARCKKRFKDGNEHRYGSMVRERTSS